MGNSKGSKPRDFMSAETRFQGKYTKDLLDTIYQAYKPVMGWVILFLLIGIFARTLLLANANIIGYWVDTFCDPSVNQICKDVPGLFKGLQAIDFVYLLVGATFFGFALTLVFRIGISRLSSKAISRIYDETTMRTSRLPMSFYDQNPSGRVITRFSSDYNNVFRIFGGPLAEFIGQIFDLLAMTVLIAVASPWFLPFWLFQAIANYFVYRLFLPSLRRERRETALKRSPGIAHFSETVVGVNSIRAFGRQSSFMGRFSKLNDSYLAQRLKATTVFVWFSLSMSAVTIVAFLMTGLASIWLVKNGHLSVGAVGVAFAYFGLSTNILQSFFEWLGQFEEAMTGLERLNEYLRMPLEPGAVLPKTATIKTGHRIEGEIQEDEIAKGRGATIEVQNLSMRYRDDLPLVLSSVDLHIKAGEKVAIVGKTGSGKTSLVQALFRLYPIEQGILKVGGKSADTGAGGVSLTKYRSSMAYITQQATLFLGTIRTNLDSSGLIEDEMLIEALRRVQFLEATSTHGDYKRWLDFPISENGSNLSVGERQLICMARCLLQDAPVVILDEATSSVDPKSEEIITKATDEFFKGKTLLIIAHRLSTIQSCDRVVWLQNGRVHKSGSPKEILPEFKATNLDV